jgi:hypothetical protein
MAKMDPADWTHGVTSTYNNHGCRCDLCKDAATRSRQAWLESLKDRSPYEIPHGTVSGYKNWGCRCEYCGPTNTQYERFRKKIRAEKKRQEQEETCQTEQSAPDAGPA